MSKPDALRLAAELEACPTISYKTHAAELRRLHAEKEALREQRDALLEALKSTGLFLHHCWCDVQMNDHSFEKLNRQMEIVDAAIKAVEGEKV